MLENNIVAHKVEDKGFKELFGKDFFYHHKGSFDGTYAEIFQKGIYTFKPEQDIPLIIDCGASMGLSVLFFSKHYPNAKIIAFEPDESVLWCLERNIKTYKLNNVTLFKQAVWDSDGRLAFYTNAKLGGRVKNKFENQEPRMVETIRLKSFIGDQFIDFLKLDIEGAEFQVIKDCESILNQINCLFVEYHNFQNEEQHLDELLSILKRNEFRYHLSQSFSRNKPFVENTCVGETIEMAINIYAYKA
jgi:FkbM family methyltransferase